MLSEMSSDEITEWEAFDSIEPIGAERLDLLIALATSTIVNFTRCKEVLKVNDLVPRFWREDTSRKHEKVNLQDKINGIFGSMV